MRGCGETLVEYCTGVDHLTVCTSHEKWKKQLQRWAIRYPDEVKIIKNKDKSIYAQAPVDWFRFIMPTFQEKQK